MCAIQGTLEPRVGKPTILVFAGDHGVCEEGVNPFPQAVTRQMLENFLSKGAAINALASVAQAELIVVDVGVIGPPIQHAHLVTRKIGQGTCNFCRSAAMSKEDTAAAIKVGSECARTAIDNGATLLGLGEMGIGNTTVASALCAALTGMEPSLVCGRGTGSDDVGLVRKQAAVRRALELHGSELSAPLDVLARLGGFEIAAMCGVCLEAARSRCAVLIDGFISTAAAAVAVCMKPGVRDYLIASHRSVEPGHTALLNLLGLDPLFDLRMRLGEGTGAALAIPVVRAAVAAFVSMATFASAGVSEAPGM
jgi:nicotinate-nucleotide--dimethylbenzimidazole phosphoribosyltransferase